MKENPHIDVLATPRPVYRGRDFFQRSDFRGMLIADHQSALGSQAKESVELLNKTCVSKFPQLETYQNSFLTKKKIDKFYKSLDKKLKKP